jgi:hypothetical protein
MRVRSTLGTLLPLAIILLVPDSASAIPAFARKYETSCQTCHTVYPRLTPFGEAFRRNNYRFPGVDSDMAKQPTVPLGQDAYKDMFPDSVWPDWIPSGVPLSLGFNGAAVLHPDTKSSGGLADNGSPFTLHDLIAEGHLWAGGSFSDTITYFSEITFASDGTIDIEHARVMFNDLIGPAHAVNLSVGRMFQGLSSFGMHSSYASDTRMLAAPVAQFYSATTDAWNVLGQYNGLELNGVVASWLDYNVGINAGSNIDIRPTENVYAHVGYKIGGMTLDGEGSPSDPTKPWAENALTLDIFAVHSNTRFTNGTTMMPQQNVATTLGGGIRAQWESLELDAGAYWERDHHAQADGTSAVAIVQYDELSYIVFPWLVPAIRFEWIMLQANDTTLSNEKIMPSIAMLIRPNIKVLVVGTIEAAQGGPPLGWTPGGSVISLSDPSGLIKGEIESLTATFAFAF